MYFTKSMRISGTGSYTPEKILSNAELAEKVDTDAGWIKENLGIDQRRISAQDEYTSDLASKAGAEAITAAGTNKNDIDLVIVATATPDRKAPSTACLTKNKIGISNHCPALDISAVCSGFIYSLNIASSLIETGAHRKILVIGADTFSKITDWNRRDCVFFGDGAGAVVLEKSNHNDALFCGEIFSDTENTDNFTVYPNDDYFTMNGRAVYETGSRVLPEAIRRVLAKASLSIGDVSAIIPHQPSSRLLKKMAEHLDIPFSKVKTNMVNYANTSGATVPLLLDETVKKGEIKNGDIIVLAAVGSGWTWGASIYRWH